MSSEHVARNRHRHGRDRRVIPDAVSGGGRGVLPGAPTPYVVALMAEIERRRASGRRIDDREEKEADARDNV